VGSGAGGGLNPTAPGSPGGGFGIVQPLDRSTRLILTGSAADVAGARQILDEVDVAPEQVEIEAEVLEVDASNTADLGITWNINNAGVTFSTANVNPSVAPGFNPPTTPPIILPNGTVVPGTTAGLPQGFRFGTVTNGVVTTPDIFTASVQAQTLQGHVRILASPHVSVVNNEDASIFIGDQIPYTNSTSQNGTSTTQNVTFLPVGIALLVRPRIHDDEITMKVHPVVSTLTQSVQVAPGVFAPQTSVRETDTTVRVADGGRFVIGGLFQESERRSVFKLPGFGDIPVVGQFFRSRHTDRSRTEIVVSLRVKKVANQIEEPEQEEENGKDHSARNGTEQKDSGKNPPQHQIELKGNGRKPASKGNDRGDKEPKS
jgi:type II secretory pathway component GspD/PulD (secretin)